MDNTPRLTSSGWPAPTGIGYRPMEPHDLAAEVAETASAEATPVPAVETPSAPPRWRRWLGPLAIVGVALLKLKTIVGVLLKLKFVGSAASMVVSVAAYALLWGWRFALGFVLLLWVHEMGHVLQLRREGIPASAPMFIPFLGAVIWAKSLGDDAAAEARTALAGPILGSIGAAACLPIYVATDNQLFLALAYTGFFLNLFNLLPISPLDGGRAAGAISPWIWLVGLAGMVALLVMRPNPILILIALIGGVETWSRLRAYQKGEPEARAYHRLSGGTRTAIAAVYFGLVGVLAVAMYATHVPMTV